MRYYISGGDKEIDRFISEAENKSFTICEYCGSKDDVKQTGKWIKTLCWRCRGENKDIQFYPSAPEALVLPIEKNKP